MTNKQRREIVNKAQEEGYQGSYVELFRNPPLGSISPTGETVGGYMEAASEEGAGVSDEY